MTDRADCKDCGVAFDRTLGQIKNRDYRCASCRSRRNAIRNSLPHVKEIYRFNKKKRRSEGAYKLQDRARKKVWKALKKGRLVRCPCKVCGNPQSEAHHTDYEKPLEVEWLCRKHHVEMHRRDVA